MNSASSPAPKVLAIIVTWNKKPYVLDLLASLQNLDYPASSLDIVVVDNASEDGSAEAIAAAYPQVELLRNEENLGGTGGFNSGMRWALAQTEQRYAYWWLLDNDVQVHRNALAKLVEILEQQPGIGVAGSTMMQLDYPWRINEMGCFVRRHDGMLVLNRHQQEIAAWRSLELEELLAGAGDLSRLLMHCRPMMDVDYVAAASLLVRPRIAREIGLWRDYFIHYDDVEWCLRIAAAGWRIVVSAQSLIWHLSAAAKVPTWVLYYDNRNVLDLLLRHAYNPAVVHGALAYTLKKGMYYTLMGKPDLGRLHREAAADFLAGNFGKKAIHLDAPYRLNREIGEVFMQPEVRRVLVSFAVNLQATGIQGALAEAVRRRPELHVEFMNELDGTLVYQLPRQHFTRIPANRLRRWWRYWRLRNRYDLVVQSDYRMVLGLSWLDAELLFVNDEGFCRRPRPRLGDVWQAGTAYLKALFLHRI